jgi:MFS family permease
MTLFLVGAIIGGWAKDVFMLLGGRIVQGIGAAGSISLSIVILTDIVSLRRRAPWLGAINAMWAFGSVSGPVIGGALAHTNWVSYQTLNTG